MSEEKHTPEFHVMFRPKMQIWTLTACCGAVAACSYENKEDAWQYAQTLARKANGIAIFWSRDGKDDRRISFQNGQNPVAQAVA
jgi:hypothetical protein